MKVLVALSKKRLYNQKHFTWSSHQSPWLPYVGWEAGVTSTCSMPGLSGLYSGLVSTCSGTKRQPTFGISSQWCSTAKARCSSVNRILLAPAVARKMSITTVSKSCYWRPTSFDGLHITTTHINESFGRLSSIEAGASRKTRQILWLLVTKRHKVIWPPVFKYAISHWIN